RGGNGSIRIADAKRGGAADQGDAKIIGNAGNFAIHQSAAIVPLAAAAGGGGLDPKGDGKAIADGAGDGYAGIGAVELRRLRAEFARGVGEPAGYCSISAVAGGVLRRPLKRIPGDGYDARSAAGELGDLQVGATG